MKLILVFTLLFSTVLNAQMFDSSYVGANRALVTKGNKILTFSIPQDGNDIISVQYFDGFNWRNISQDTMPTIHLHNSQCTFSQFSNHLFVSGQYHLWEFNEKDWIKHAIYDSLYHLRRYESIIELPDSSLLITAFTKFIVGSSGNHTSIGKIFHEVLKFKNGVFTTIKSRWSEPNDDLLIAYQKLKLNRNGTYSMFTMDESSDKRTWELVSYSTVDGSIVRKDVLPDLELYGFSNRDIEFNDYLFDSKGSLWFITKSTFTFARDSTGKALRDSLGNMIMIINFIGLVEVTQDGNVNFYNDNIGIQKSIIRPESFTIDADDNIWFFYNYRVSQGKLFPSLYKLHSDRIKVTEYKHETVVQHSVIYNGGNTNYSFSSPEYILLVFNDSTKSLFATRGGTPLLRFFPETVTSVEERKINPYFLYPNPVPNGKNVIIEKNEIGNNLNLKYLVSDIGGNVLREETTNSNGNKVSINTEGLIRGSYLISVFNNNKLIVQSLFIKE